MTAFAEELAISTTEAASLYREIQQCASNQQQPIPKTVSQILQETSGALASSPNSIITFCRQVDQLLGGGIALGELTEVAGVPGSGKTQLGMQLAVTARLPHVWGGVQGETLYIDSEGSFAPERCLSMATALVNHIQYVQRRRVPQNETPDWFNPESILRGIHVLRVHDEGAQMSTLLALESLLQTHRNVKLVVIDSIAFHHRASASRMDSTPETAAQLRTLLVQLAGHLGQVATRHRVAVVAMNQMTTTKTATGDFATVPALGEAWAHAVTTRLLLSPSPNPASDVRRTCQLTKSPRLPAGQADFTVVESGIRGADETNKRKHDQVRTSSM